MPGLGQLLLGRKLRGIACIMAINLVLLLGLFVVLKTLSPVIAAQIAGGSSLSVAQIVDQMQASSGFGQSLLAAFFLIWGYALFDIVKGKDASREE